MSASPEQIQAIRQLRENQVGPKQIARKLKLRPAEVSAVIRADAAAHPEKHRRALPPLRECLINASAADYFFPEGGAAQQKKLGWFKQLSSQARPDESNGMAQIIISRDEGSRYSVTSYLVDYWCLGVKDAMGPQRMNRAEYLLMRDKAYTDGFGEDYRELSLTQAQAIIFGAIDYARQIGFEPHQDFERAKVALSDREPALPLLEFGKDGKPAYFSGPYDNPSKILQTLEKTVGQDKYQYVVPLGDPLGEQEPIYLEG